MTPDDPRPRIRRRPSRLLTGAAVFVILALGIFGFFAALTIQPRTFNEGEPVVRGEIVGWVSHAAGSPNTAFRAPILAFEAGGQRYRETAALDLISSAQAKYPVGSEVDVHYQRDNPRFAWFMPTPLLMASFTSEAEMSVAIAVIAAIAVAGVHAARVSRWRAAHDPSQGNGAVS